LPSGRVKPAYRQAGNSALSGNYFRANAGKIFTMYFYFAFSAIFNAIVSALLGFFIFFKNKKSEANRSFAYFCAAVAVWSIFYVGWPLSNTAAQALLWFQLLHIGACFTPVTYFHFVVSWLGLNRQKKFFVIFGYFLAVFFSLFVFSHYFIAGMVPKFSLRFWAVPGILYHFYLLYFFGYAIFSSVLLYLSYKKASGLRKQQIKLLLLGLILSFLGGSTNYFLWYNINIPPYGNILASSFVVFTAYAIIKYRLMDIRIVFRKSFIYLGGALFAFCFLSLFIWFFTINFNISGLYFYVFLTAVIFTAGFYYFEILLTKVANKYFFAGLYNYQETIKILSRELTYHNNLAEIIDSIVNTIENTMRLDRVGVLLANRSRQPAVFKIAKVTGFSEKDGLGLVKDNFLAKRLEKTKLPLVADELLFLAQDAKLAAERKGLETLHKNMSRIEVSLCLPLINERKLIGIIVLGAKFSGGAYTSEDLELLATLADQAGIAINNAQLYQQVKDFNLVLRSKIDEQTRELKKEAKELEEKNKNLNKLLEIKNEFLRVVNHQLNTPVSIIKNSVFMIKSGAFSLEKGLSFIEEGVKRMEEIFTDFWKAFSFEGEGIKLNLRKTNLEEILDKLVENAANAPAVKSRGLSVRIDKNISIPKVNSDPRQIAQAASNLLENAISYTASGSVLIYFKNQDNKFLKVFIEDTGCGIDKEDKPRLFEKFIRGRRAMRERPSGSGLGLYIAKRIVDANGGELKLEKSEVGKGTTFSFTVPIWR
jgi:signal transduction histidine kinase